jgi:hypothetical protein
VAALRKNCPHDAHDDNWNKADFGLSVQTLTQAVFDEPQADPTVGGHLHLLPVSFLLSNMQLRRLYGGVQRPCDPDLANVIGQGAVSHRISGELLKCYGDCQHYL